MSELARFCLCVWSFRTNKMAFVNGKPDVKHLTSSAEYSRLQNRLDIVLQMKCHASQQYKPLEIRVLKSKRGAHYTMDWTNHFSPPYAPPPLLSWERYRAAKPQSCRRAARSQRPHNSDSRLTARADSLSLSLSKAEAPIVNARRETSAHEGAF